MVEGGKGTLEAASQAIKEGTPVVVFKHTGRAADILAFAYENSEYVLQKKFELI